MADGVVGLAVDGVGKKVDTTELTVGVNTVGRQRVHLSGSTAAALVEPSNTTPAGTEYALPTRNIPSGKQAITVDQTDPGVTNGVQVTALSYPSSTSNNSTAQLAASAVFTGGIETVLSLQAAQIMVTCDQPYTVFIDQFIDLAGTKLVATYTFTRATGAPLNENVTLPGNYMRVRVQNTGAAATTTFRLETTFGIMDTQPNTLSNNGNLRVVAMENGVTSLVNSSTTNLAASGVFTGSSEDVSEFSMVMVNLFSSHASATDGLSVQQSSDGTNWDFSDVFTIPAATGKAFSFAVQAKYFRVVFTNSATATTTFRIQTLYSRTVKKPSSVRPQDGRPNDNDFEENLGYMMAFDGTAWNRVRSSAKAIQATSAVATQHLKDSGRVIWSVASAIAGVTAVTAEALVTMIPQRDGTAAATATSHTVTSGKRLRITSMTVGLISTGAAVLSGRISLRLGASAAATATSPIIHTLAIPSGAALAQAGGSMTMMFPDGLEIAGAQQVGVSQICSAATGTIWVSLSGFEY